MKIGVKKVREGARLPYRATEGSAGADLFAYIESETVIGAGEQRLIPTGIAIELNDPETGAFIFPRSSLAAKNGVSLSNCVGVIDSDYRGEIKIPLFNHSDRPYTVSPGDRIAQMVILPILLPEWEEVDSLGETERAEGGFGSTGV
ncbi:MAG: dUTP diphosphatase [Bacteroides sp.]|nr:dUTP diphosphatase [Eubacterium sp.]MCM1418938.1 dUTP diphosphatase [Roseburia sp.]MCM1462118.1 dUTP diphosphatase [Bacteroides sp.]